MMLLKAKTLAMSAALFGSILAGGAAAGINLTNPAVPTLRDQLSAAELTEHDLDVKSDNTARDENRAVIRALRSIVTPDPWDVKAERDRVEVHRQVAAGNLDDQGARLVFHQIEAERFREWEAAQDWTERDKGFIRADEEEMKFLHVGGVYILGDGSEEEAKPENQRRLYIESVTHNGRARVFREFHKTADADHALGLRLKAEFAHAQHARAVANALFWTMIGLFVLSVALRISIEGSLAKLAKATVSPSKVGVGPKPEQKIGRFTFRRKASRAKPEKVGPLTFSRETEVDAIVDAEIADDTKGDFTL